MVADELALDEVLLATSEGEIIEDYPTDHPLPSGLTFGFYEKRNPGPFCLGV